MVFRVLSPSHACAHEAIERELEGRRGTNQHTKKEDVENFPQAESGEKTRDIAAKAAGFGNGKTYEQAKKVSNEAAPELVQAMNEGRASVSAAASLGGPRFLQAWF